MSRSETSAALPMATRALRASAENVWPRTEEAPSQTPDDHSVAESLPTVCKADLVRDDLTGLRLGHYALGEKIGAGGMGKVFYARHLHLDRIVAIKFMATDVLGSSEAQQRFEQETLALGKLQHPHVVNAVDAGCIAGLRFLATEFVDGEDLAKRIQRCGKLAYREACELIRQAAVGLAHSHAAGFVHRDIKPSNLMVDRKGVVKILDFGLVRNVQVDHQLTGNGDMMGTWDFLAPEQSHDASNVDHRCDLYSLGCTLLYLLSGQVPFGGDKYATPAAKLKGHLLDTPVALTNARPVVPPELLKVLRRMLAKSPADRFRNASEVVSALAPFTSDEHSTTYNTVTSARGRRTSTTRLVLRNLICVCLPFVVIGFAISQLRIEVVPNGIKAAELRIPPSLPMPVAEPVPATENVERRVDQQEVAPPPIAPEKLTARSVEIHSFAASPDELLPKTSRRITVDSDQTNNAAPLIVPFESRSGRVFRRHWKAN